MSAYDKGREAFFDENETNPYPRMTNDWHEWERGFHNAGDSVEQYEERKYESQ